MEFKKMIVLGSNSFTAGHFIDYALKNLNYEIIGISRSSEYDPVFLPYLYKKKRSSRYSFYQLDINENIDEIFSICENFKPEIIVNFAAQGEVRNSWKWPEQWYKTNCLSVIKLTEYLKQKDYLKRYVAISTPEVYGSTELDVIENHNYYPSTPYAASKLAGDLHLFTLYKHYDFPVVFTRSANLYGLHQQLYRIIPRTIIYLKLGKKIDLHGKGKSMRAFIHAREVAELTMQSIVNGKNGNIYHFSPDDGLRSIASVVNLICELMGCQYENSVNLIEENYGQDSLYSLDASKVKNDFGWKQNISFQSGIIETIDWIESNWNYISKQSVEYIHKN